MGCGASSSNAKVVEVDECQLENVQDLGLVWGNYKVEHLVGHGSAGNVMQGRCLITDQIVALKKVKPGRSATSQSRGAGLDVTQNEIECLRRIKHTAVVHLVETFELDKNIVIVQELVQGGDLWSRICKHRTVPEDDCKIVMRQLFKALSYLHRHDVCHRDLKPENILCVSNDPTCSAYWMVKICDFGLSSRDAKGYDSVMEGVCGTPEFAAPEMLEACLHRQSRYSSKIDIWSLGVVLYAMLCGRLPFIESDLAAMYKQVMKADIKKVGTKWGELSDEAKFAVKSMLCVEPEERPTASDCLQLVFIRDHAWRDRSRSGSPSTRSFKSLCGFSRSREPSPAGRRTGNNSPVGRGTRGNSPDGRRTRSLENSQQSSPRLGPSHSPTITRTSSPASCRDISFRTIRHHERSFKDKLSKLESSYEAGWGEEEEVFRLQTSSEPMGPASASEVM